jgi:hypothetical protein
VPVFSYFFDTYDGDLLVSPEEEQEVEDFKAAHLEGEKALPEAAWDGLPNGDQQIFIVSIRDEAGNVVLRITLSKLVEYLLQSLGMITTNFAERE